MRSHLTGAALPKDGVNSLNDANAAGAPTTRRILARRSIRRQILPAPPGRSTSRHPPQPPAITTTTSPSTPPTTPSGATPSVGKWTTARAPTAMPTARSTTGISISGNRSLATSSAVRPARAWWASSFPSLRLLSLAVLVDGDLDLYALSLAARSNLATVIANRIATGTFATDGVLRLNCCTRFRSAPPRCCGSSATAHGRSHDLVRPVITF